MNPDDLTKTDSTRLARMMQTASGERPIWEPADLASMLDHLLQSPVDAQIGLAPGEDGPTFLELLTGEHPPLESLEAIKQFAKSCRSHPDSALPPEIAEVLYLASIVAARVRCAKSISALDDAAIRSGIQKILTYSWLSSAIRSLFEEFKI